MNIRKTLAAGVLGLALAFAPLYAGAEEPKSAKGAVELMAGQESGTLDTKVTVQLNSRMKLFNRNRVTSDYDGNVSSFHVATLAVNLVDSLDAVAGAEAVPGKGITPIAGLQYFKKAGDFSVYQLLTSSLAEDWSLTSITNLGYGPMFNDKVGLVTGLENTTKFNEEGHQFSTQRLRLGLKTGKFQWGAAGDLVELGPAGELGYNVGGIGRVLF